MNTSPLRYTGDNPTAEDLEQFPNWEYALDEEDIEGQDETTIRPATEQRFLATDVVFSAGLLTLADGTRLSALLEVNDGEIEGVTAFVNRAWAWTVRLLGAPSRWESIGYEWLPESERPPTISLNDPKAFPLTIESLLPRELGGSVARLTIPKD